MALPAAPIVVTLLRYALLLALVAAALRKRPLSAKDIDTQKVLDRLDDGLHVAHHPDTVVAASKGRWRFRVSPKLPEYEIEATLLSRLRLRRLSS